MAYTVAQNTTFLTAASVAQKIVSFVYFTIVARVIGVGNTGQYFFAIAFTTIFNVVADFGLAPVLTREVSKNPEKAEKYVQTILWVKVFFGLLAYAIVVLAVGALHYMSDLRQLIYLSGVTMFFDNISTTFYSVFRAKKNLIYEALGMVLAQIITMVIGTLALFYRAPLYWLIIAYAIPSALNCLYAGYFLHRVFGFVYRPRFDYSIFKTFFTFAIPFALAGIVSRVYAYSDSVLISKMYGAEHLGWWSVPYKITFAFQFIATSLSASVYPAMSAAYASNKEEVARLFEKAWHYLFFVVFPLTLGLMAVGKPVIKTLYGEGYVPSVAILKILLISLIFGFLSFITGALLNATNNQKTQTVLLIAALFVNLPLNIVLLPRIGLLGAAFAALAGNMVLAIGGYVYSARIVPINALNVLRNAWSIFWPSALMAICAYGIALHSHWVLAVASGVCIYAILLLVSGKISKSLVFDVWKKLLPKSTV